MLFVNTATRVLGAFGIGSGGSKSQAPGASSQAMAPGYGGSGGNTTAPRKENSFIRLAKNTFSGMTGGALSGAGSQISQTGNQHQAKTSFENMAGSYGVPTGPGGFQGMPGAMMPGMGMGAGGQLPGGGGMSLGQAPMPPVSTGNPAQDQIAQQQYATDMSIYQGAASTTMQMRQEQSKATNAMTLGLQQQATSSAQAEAEIMKSTGKDMKEAAA